MTLKALLKKTKVTYVAAKALRRAPDPFIRAYMRACHRLRGVKGDKVYFSSFNGSLYNDNPRAVCEALLPLRPGADIVFCMNGRGMKMTLPEGVRKVRRYTPKAFCEMATSRVICKNASLLPCMVKFPDQYYIQLWHGDRGFKRVQLDIGRDTKRLRQESGWIDLAVSGSDFGTRVFRGGFAIQNEILECGCPRNDMLLNDPEPAAKRVRDFYRIDPDTRILLYAPTFRDASTGANVQASLSLQRLCDTLQKTRGGKWMCLTRSHMLNTGVTSDAALDASAYPETADLLCAADMLITDYSSIGGDFMLLGRPVFYYEPDQAFYLKERGLYFDPNESPLKVARTEEELLSLIAEPFDAAENCRQILDFFGAKESGNAARIVAERILSKLM